MNGWIASCSPRACAVYLALSCASPVSAQSGKPAPPPPASQVSARHALSACMSHQMQISRTISYNEASRVCKAQMKAHDNKWTADIATQGEGR